MTRESQVLLGHGVSPGIAIGQAVCFHDRPLEIFRIPLLETGVEQEVTRFHRAVAQAQEELLATRQKARDVSALMAQGYYDWEKLKVSWWRKNLHHEVGRLTDAPLEE